MPHIRKVILFLVVIEFIGLVWFGINPMALQKGFSVKLGTIPRIDEAPSVEPIDHERIMREIPYQIGKPRWSVEPKKRYESTIVEGLGNCAQRVSGYSYLMLQKEQEFLIVDFLPLQSWRDGGGHTVMWAPVQSSDATSWVLLDIDSAGIIYHPGGARADLSQLSSDDISRFQLRKASGSDALVNWEAGLGLRESVSTYIHSSDVRRYFDFIEAIYIPVTNPYFETLIFDGMAMLFGYYPTRWINSEDAAELFSGLARLERYLAILFVWFARVLFLLFFGVLVVRGIHRLRKTF